MLVLSQRKRPNFSIILKPSTMRLLMRLDAFFRKNRAAGLVYGSVSKPCTPVVHIKIAGKWMFIPLKIVFSWSIPIWFILIYLVVECQEPSINQAYGHHPRKRTHLELNEGGPISERKKHLGEGSEVIWCTLARKKSNPRCNTDLDESADESADERAP